jgi:hypothetical protein
VTSKLQREVFDTEGEVLRR